MIKLKEFQERAVSDLLDSCNRLIGSPENEICIFEAPTGSGKTIMTAEFLKRFAKENSGDKKFSFIWVSVRRLHTQSRDKLEKYYERDQALRCSEFKELSDQNLIDEDEILFLNWESIRSEEKNIITREDKETDNHLRAVLENTKAEGREIILVIVLIQVYGQVI